MSCTAVSDREVGGGDSSWDVEGIGGGSSPIIVFDTCTTQAIPEFEFGCKSDCVLRAASPVLFPNDSFHLLGFFVIVGVDTGVGTSGGGGTLGNDCTEAEAERSWWLSSQK